MSAAKARLDCRTTPARVERDHAGGNGFDDGLQLAAPLLDCQVGRGELRLRAFGQLAAGFKIRRHVIEGTHQVGHFAGGDGGDAMLVFAGGDLVHGIGQRFNGARDLLGEKQRQPDAGEKTKTVISNSKRKKMVRMRLRERKSCQ